MGLKKRIKLREKQRGRQKAQRTGNEEYLHFKNRSGKETYGGRACNQIPRKGVRLLSVNEIFTEKGNENKF